VLTEPQRVSLAAFLPWLGQAPWVRLEWPQKWAAEMSLQAELHQDRVDIVIDNVRSFRLLSAGALEDLDGPRQLVIDGRQVGTLDPGFGEVRGAADVEGHWTFATAAPIDWDAIGFVGRADEALRRDNQPSDAWDSDLGNWFCDSILFGAGADVAFQNNGGMRTDMEHDAISIRDLFTMNFPNVLQAFQRSGRQLLTILEHDVLDGKDRPMQIAGVSYSFDRSRPEGQRIVASDIDPDATYTIAAEAYLVQRGDRFFGAAVEDWTDTQTEILDAQIRFVQQHGTVMAPASGQIREIGR